MLLASGLALQGCRPVVAIYSTFLQRAFDEIVHDVCLQKLNVTFALDRAGLVGDDGPTHHGVFDIAYLRPLPNIVLMAPRDEAMLVNMLRTALTFDQGPCAIRYPAREAIGVPLPEEPAVIPVGTGEILREADSGASGPRVALLGYGTGVDRALGAAPLLEQHGLAVTVADARFAKPIDAGLAAQLAAEHDLLVTLEEGVLAGGFGTAVWETLSEIGVAPRMLRIGMPDRFVTHGAPKLLYAEVGYTAERVAERVLAAVAAKVGLSACPPSTAGLPAASRSAMASKTRLDVLLTARGLFESRARAAAAVLAGEILLGPGRERAAKPGQSVADDVEVEVAGRLPYVSRGGVKLANALDGFGLEVVGAHALDIGASTGGFTDCLLQRGAAHVVAVDVAYGELSWKLREDPRVTVIERRNARTLSSAELPYAPELIVMDLSFISLTKVLPAALACAAARYDCLAMVKPQFEVGRERIGKGRGRARPRGATLRAGVRWIVRAAAGRGGGRLRELGVAGTEGQPRDVRVAARALARDRRDRPRGCGAGGRAEAEA